MISIYAASSIRTFERKKVETVASETSTKRRRLLTLGLLAFFFWVGAPSVRCSREEVGWLVNLKLFETTTVNGTHVYIITATLLLLHAQTIIIAK